MEVINKLHKDIVVTKKFKLSAYIKVASLKYFYLSSFFVTRFGINPTQYVHLVNANDNWYLYFNDDINGFKLVRRSNKNGLLITNVALVKLFLSRTKCGVGSKFHIQPTKNKIGESELIEILINKPFEK